MYISAGVPAFIMGPYPYYAPMEYGDPEGDFFRMLWATFLFACMLLIVSSGVAPTAVVVILIPCTVLFVWRDVVKFLFT